MGWKSILTRWFMTTKQEVTCEESQEKGLYILDLRSHDLEDCEDFTKLLSPEYMQALKGLLLQRNDLQEFSNALPHYLPEIKYLTLDYNKLRDLPFDMRHMTELTVLNVSHNCFVGLRFFHVICQLRSLKILWANATGIWEIPREIKELKKLRTLGLRRNKIKVLPDELLTLPNLRWLTLSSNQISEIPEGVQNLKRVVHLNLNHNRLTDLPTTLIYMQELQYLFVKHNFIRITEEVVDFVKNIPNLKCCAVRGNLPTFGGSNADNTDEITMPSDERRRGRRGLQSPVSSDGENIWYSESETQEEANESTPSGTEMGREYYESSVGQGSGPAPEAMSDDLETVYRYGRQSLNGSIDVSNSLEFQGKNEVVPLTKLREEESNDLDPNIIDNEIRSGSHKILESNRQASSSRIQEWLLKQHHPESGNGNVVSSSTSISPPSTQNEKDDHPAPETRDTDIDIGEGNFHVKEQVDCVIRDAVEMVTLVTNSVEQTPIARTTSMYILPFAKKSTMAMTNGPSTSATFHCRRSTSSVVVTPSTLFQVRSEMKNDGSNGTESSPQNEDNEYEEGLEGRDDHRHHFHAPVSTEPEQAISIPDSGHPAATVVEPDRVLTPTASQMFPSPPFEIDTTCDPSDWEHSSPSSDIDDQDIVARFNEFSDVYLADDVNNNAGRLDEDDWRFLIPLMYLT